jgi:hypothetical protein
MGKARPRYDVHCWNLDYLENSSVPPVGDIRPVFPPDPNSDDKIAILGTGEVATLRRRDNVLEVFRPDLHQRLELHKFDKHEKLVDMTVVQNTIYFFEGSRGEISRFEVSSPRQTSWGDGNLKIVSTERWFLGHAYGRRFARLAIRRDDSGKPSEAYLAPTPAGGILAVELTADLKVRHLPPPPGSTGLADSVYLCVDARAQTLLVTEPESQRITEIDLQTSESKLLWSLDYPARLDEMGDHFKPERSRPSAVAIYRTRRLIPPNILKPGSQDLLAADPKKIRPRTLLIADAGNFCLWKLVQLPYSARLLDHSGRNQLLAFLGSGLPCQVTKNFHPTDREKENLRNYIIPPPREVSVSSFGEVLVRSDPEWPLLLLRPATAKVESWVGQEAKSRRLDWSD